MFFFLFTMILLHLPPFYYRNRKILQQNSVWCKKTFLSIFTRNDLNIPLYEIYKNDDDDDDYSWLHWLSSYGESHGYSTDSSETFTRQKTLKPQTHRATPGQKSRSALWLNARANTQTSLTHSCWETLLLIWSGVSAS